MAPHWLSKDRLTLYSAAFFVIYLATALLLLLRFPSGADPGGNTVRPDFIVFWGASHLALSGNPQGAYDLATIVEVERLTVPHLQFAGAWVYPPTFYLVILPLALLPFFWSYLAFMALTLVPYVWVVRRIAASPAALMPVLGFPAVCINLLEGQNGFLTASLLGGALLLLPRRAGWAGVLIGLLTIKPQLGILLPLVLLCGRHWRALLTAAATASLFLALSLAVLGIDTLWGFFSNLGDFSTWAASYRELQLSSPTFFSFFRVLGMSGPTALLLHGILALPVCIATGVLWYARAEEALCSAAVVVAVLLVSPYLLDHDLTCLALAIASFARYALRFGWRRGERELLVLAWLLPALMVPMRELLQLQLAPFVLLALFLMILRRALEKRVPGSAEEGRQSGGGYSISPRTDESTEYNSRSSSRRAVSLPPQTAPVSRP